MDLRYLTQYLTGPLVSNWCARVSQAEQAKLRFTTIARLCRQFFGSSAKAMWEDSFRKEFFPNMQAPMFMININKAFDLVSIVGPSLYWDNPERRLRSHPLPNQAEIAMLMGEQGEEQLQALQQYQQMIETQREIRNNIGSAYLAFSAAEQQNTLKSDIRNSIQESLLTGLGLIWTETYTHPGTGETLTRNTYGSVDDLLIDPDSRDPEWRDAKYIIVKHREPVWEVERRFGLPPGYLTGRGTCSSAEHEAIREAGQQRYADMMDWYEIWSKGGIGARIGGVDPKISQMLDEVAGQNVYLCVSPNVPHPLNLPTDLIQNGTVEQIKDAVRWRTFNYGMVHEVWKDSRWPVSPLKHYNIPGSPWPMAVLGPGLGYLIAINIIMVTKLEMSWERRRDIIAVAQSVKDTVETALRTDANPAIIPISVAIERPLQELVQFLVRPTSQDDLLQWMQYLSEEFAKTTGLLDLYYGITRTQARVSSDIDAKQQAANVRPEQMMQNVVDWIQHFSTSEFWLASQYVQGQQLEYLVGPYGVMVWDQMIRTIPLEMLMRECTCSIDAKDIKRPDKNKDLDALQMIAPVFFSTSAEYAKITGDTEPWNAFVRRLLTAMDMRDFDDLMFKPMTPPSDPIAQQMQQQAAMLELQKLQAEAAETEAKTMGRAVDTMYKQQGLTPQAVQKLTFDQQKHQQQMLQDEEVHLQEILQAQERHRVELQQIRSKPKPAAGTQR